MSDKSKAIKKYREIESNNDYMGQLHNRRLTLSYINKLENRLSVRLPAPLKYEKMANWSKEEIDDYFDLMLENEYN